MRAFLRSTGLTTALLLPTTLPAADAPDLEGLYAPYQQILDAHLIEKKLDGGGLVSAFDYDAAMADPATDERLGKQKEALAEFDPEQLEDRLAATAFWINAYNFFMLQHILENPINGAPVDSVKEYGSFFNPYKVFSRKLFAVGGRNYSLDNIEKGVLLGDDYAERGWKDARVHFAVNCASVGCPPLRSGIYTADNVDALLDENTRRALSTPYHLQRDGDTLLLTQLFEWYAADYRAEADAIRDWLLRFADAPTAEKIRSTSAIDFIEYDWRLNRPENFPELAR
ncbi:DUF547 domain-containing protein [Algiphilus aromaticivorans]|uniref:DUF547 domain-containing protein n=1 Tax=Algiphilus aromaticivorans TaxID=382454 RepID=UPI0005C1EA27|nr:DUF547 domain-containing protein [Algiphilus aromaticivorans]